jgi:polyisoprenoid-binding protein YceI
MSDPSIDAPRPSRRRWPWIVLALVVLASALAVGGVVWFLRDDAPPEVSLEGALAGVTTTLVPADTATTAAPDTATTAGASGTTAREQTATSGEPPAGVDGVWSVDTSIGEFDFQAATGSFVGFRVAEELQGIGSTEAVGRTPAVTGTIEIEGGRLLAAFVEADLTRLVTDDSRRDSRARGALETDQFPTATFVLTEPVDLGDAADSGGPLTGTAVGELTVHGVTRPVEVELEAQRSGDVIAVVGRTPVVFADYGVSVPSAPIVVSAADNGLVELQLLFTRQ